MPTITAFAYSFWHASNYFYNGDGEIRTLDPLLARQVLSQLSYTPKINLAATYSPISFPI